jgi:hypothetical protein
MSKRVSPRKQGEESAAVPGAVGRLGPGGYDSKYDSRSTYGQYRYRRGYKYNYGY